MIAMVMEHARLIGSGAVLLALAMGGPAAAQAPTGELVARTQLRVCADPADLPFSDQKLEGFENKIAALMGQELAVPVTYAWFPQVVGFVRNTLGAGRCDLIMGTVAGDDLVQTTSPYYFTSYTIVFRKDSGLTFNGFDDPRLRDLHIGVVSGTPPSDLLVRHGLMANARPYQLQIDTRLGTETHQMILDIVDKKIDAGLLWGPIAGYYIRHDNLPLTLVMLRSEPQSPRLEYHIAMGVRHNEPDWRRRVNAILQKRRGDITAILRDYGVPLLDEQGNPINP
ncbi:MAG TPA: substrate-binding domain-containing protein [Alphaproteobacteria bacterium]|nr:substrate-binding domain-containing protein [Alphaproteobacteria bacterium]